MGVAAGVCAAAIAAAAVADRCSIAARHRSHVVISSKPRQSPRTRAAPRVSSSARAGRTSTRSIICRRPRRLSLWKPSTRHAGVVSTRRVWCPRGRRGFKGVNVACSRGLYSGGSLTLPSRISDAPSAATFANWSGSAHPRFSRSLTACTSDLYQRSAPAWSKAFAFGI